MKKIRYILEIIIIYALFCVFRALPVTHASNLGGFLGRFIGKSRSLNRRVKKHIDIAFPDIEKGRQNEIISKMWDNLGRIFAEYPHLKKISRDNTEIENIEIIEPYLNNNQPIIFIGGHIGNWEINGATMLTQLNKPIALTYRPPNNPWVAKLLNKLRTLNGQIQAFSKSPEGGRSMMKTLKEGGSLGILIDQKYNEGIKTQFFGADAMTNPIFAQLALKYDCPIVPVRCERIEGANFKLTVYPPIKKQDADGNKLPVPTIVQHAQNLTEEWISDKPEQWIWLHRRWIKSKESKR